MDAQAESDPTITVVREIEVGEYGVVRVNDSFTVDNTNGVNPIGEMVIGFPENFNENLLQIDGLADNDNRLVIESIGDDRSISWYEIIFHQSVAPGSTYNFKIRTIFSNIIKFESNLFAFRFIMHPTLRIEAQSSNSTIILVGGSAPQLAPNSNLLVGNMSEGGVGLTQVLRPLDPIYSNITAFNYTSQNQNILECESVEKRFVFRSNGELFVVENYSFNNLGKAALSFKIDTPDDAKDIMLYDFIGPLWPKAQYGVESVQVSNRYVNFAAGEHFNFRLEYKIPQQDYIQPLDWWGRYRFSVDVYPSLDWVIEDLKIILELPDGMIIEEILPKENLITDSIESRRVVYDFDTVTPIDPEMKITSDYKYQVFWASLKPLTILLMLEIVVVTLVVAYNVKRPVEPVLKASLELIRKFVNLQDQKFELLQQFEKRDEAFFRGAISRREYQRRRGFNEKRLSELNRALNPIKSELSRTSSRYADMIRNFDRAESELEAVRVSKFQVRNQYRSGRIVKDAYNSIISDMDRRASKAQDTIFSLLITLREEAR
jgi:hypothetical protein